jgi:hypothetical protein
MRDSFIEIEPFVRVRVPPRVPVPEVVVAKQRPREESRAEDGRAKPNFPQGPRTWEEPGLAEGAWGFDYPLLVTEEGCVLSYFLTEIQKG